MSMTFDTPEGVSFVKACSRKGALALEIQGMHRSSGRQTAYSIVKEVYGFRGNRQSVLEDLTEYIECELRLRKLTEAEYTFTVEETQQQVDYLTELGKLDQPHFETAIAQGEDLGYITHDQRQAMSDMFYVMIVRQNAAGR
jgi:hypothetical protein